MRKVKMAAAAGVVAFSGFLAGCESLSSTENGVLFGGLAGAGIGRAIGSHNGHEAAAGWAGAGIGALVGGLFGALDDERRGAADTVEPVDFDEPAPAPTRVVRRRTVYEEDLPPIPPPRVVRRTTTTTTTTTTYPR